MTVTAVTVQCPTEIASVTAVVRALTSNGCESVTAVTDIPAFSTYARMRTRALRLICKLRSLRSLFIASPQVKYRTAAVTDRALSTMRNAQSRAVTTRD